MLIKSKKGLRALFAASAALLLILMFVSYMSGIANISAGVAIRAFFCRWPLIGQWFDVSDISNGHMIILLNVRLPRVLTGALTGMCLAVVGASFQGLFMNPLAEPYVLGVSAGASLGATIAMVFGLNTFFLFFSPVSFFAMLGALAAVGIVIVISEIKGGMRSANLLLTGISIGFFTNSISTMLVVLNADKLKMVTLWAMGSFNASSWPKTLALLPVAILGILILMIFAREMNAIATGEEAAMSFGVPVHLVRLIVIVTGAVMIAGTVASAGMVGFVGLIVPNAARMVVGPDYKKLLPLSALLGAGFLTLCDMVARTVFAPSEIPAGAITALIGAPFFVYMILRQRKGVS